MFGASATPGSYMHTAHVEEPRQKPMFQPGTVHYAAEVSDMKELDRLVAQGKEAGYPESVTLQQKETMLGMLPIHVASEHGHSDCVQYLIKKRVDLDAGDNCRVSSMHLAAIENKEDVVKILIAAQANPKLPDVSGDLPIHWAATKGHSDIIKLLVKAGSPVDPINKLSWTPLHRAAYNGRRAACETLVGLGASLTKRNKEGNTPLHLAAFMNQLSTMETLLGLAARTDSENEAGQRPVDLCITDAAREIIGKHSTTALFPDPEPVVDTQLSEEIQRLSGKSDTALGAALRQRARAVEEFPEAAEQGGGEHGGEERSLYMRPGAHSLSFKASEFLHEASQAFDDRASPYALGYQNTGEDRGSNSSSNLSERPSFKARPSASQVLSRNTSTHIPHSLSGERSSTARAVLDPTLRNAASLSTAPSVQKRASVQPAGALRTNKSSASGNTAGPPGWEGVERMGADEYQQKVKEDNRKASLAAGGAALLTANGVQLQKSTSSTQRPTSGNKKFLDKYNLSHFNLFGPS